MQALPGGLPFAHRVAAYGLTAALLLACTPPDRISGIDAESTNVLLVTLCTVRADHLGAYGYPGSTSPRIDTLAGQGVLFENVLTPAPWTRPAIASSITGLYPRSLTIEGRNRERTENVLDDSFETLAESMRAAGYHTIGITGNPNTNAAYRFDQGYDFYRDTGQDVWKGVHGKDRLTSETLSRELLGHLRADVAAGRKFFAHLVWVDAHQPLLRKADSQLQGEARWDAIEAAYDQRIRYMDRVLGELLDALRAHWGRDLLVVVTSDHGEAFRRDHRLDALHGNHLYNSTLWVPLILHHPTLSDAPRRVRERVEVVDISPTVLRLLGIPYSEGRFEGISLAGAVASGRAPPERQRQVVETTFKSALKSAIFEGRFKLIADYRPGPQPRFELYDNEGDPREQEDLAARAPGRVAVLSDHLRAWQEAHPPRVEGVASAALSRSEKLQLEALGYGEGAAGQETR